jgi:8-oxo-dGTP pyrophosphatase MutT (NUDIX family)
VRTCAGALLVRGRHILLATRADDRPFYPGVWDIIGGHCEPNETPADTLTRELLEEIGITPRIFEEIGVPIRPTASSLRRCWRCPSAFAPARTAAAQ